MLCLAGRLRPSVFFIARRRRRKTLVTLALPPDEEFFNTNYHELPEISVNVFYRTQRAQRAQKMLVALALPPGCCLVPTKNTDNHEYFFISRRDAEGAEGKLLRSCGLRMKTFFNTNDHKWPANFREYF